MKRIIFLFILSCSILFNSCRDAGNGIDMIYTRDFNIQVGSNTFDTYYTEFLVDANWANFLGTLTEEDIDRITPSFARLTNNDGIKLDFIRRATIQIFPNEDTTLTPLEMCFREDVPLNNGTTLELIPGIANFKEELTDDEFIFRIGLNFREFPPQTFRVVLDMGFQAFPK